MKGTLDLQNWKPTDFEYVVEDEQVFTFTIEDGRLVKGVEVPEVNAASLQTRDKVCLQNYGRPYTASGKPSGTYVGAALLPKIGEGGVGDAWPGCPLRS